ncbi:hypothetical protein C4K03_2431 [Pseudomonas synxantha]|uniref:Uncharacterized protein n=1 Tax=Pseudomonas synxantha TaxID=47883 RepID=A0A3G7U7S5_9PSED|nr:hypothetical protein C4K03_2431 [Pseudomonas synxantha]
MPAGFAVVKLGLADAEPLTFLSLRYACVGVVSPALLGERVVGYGPSTINGGVSVVLSL